MANNTVQPGSSSETTPQPVPSHFSGLPSRSTHPDRRSRSLRTDLSPRSPRLLPGTLRTAPRAIVRAARPAPQGSSPRHPCLDQRPGQRGGEEGGLQGRGWGEAHAGSSLRPAKSWFPPGSSRTLRTLQRHSWGTWGRPPWRAPLVRLNWGIACKFRILRKSRKGTGSAQRPQDRSAASDGPPRSRPGSQVPAATPAGRSPLQRRSASSPLAVPAPAPRGAGRVTPHTHTLGSSRS